MDRTYGNHGSIIGAEGRLRDVQRGSFFLHERLRIRAELPVGRNSTYDRNIADTGFVDRTGQRIDQNVNDGLLHRCAEICRMGGKELLALILRVIVQVI